MHLWSQHDGLALGFMHLWSRDSRDDQNLVFGHAFCSRHHRPPGIARPCKTTLGFVNHFFPFAAVYGIQARNMFFALPVELFAFVKHRLGRIGGERTSRLIGNCIFNILGTGAR